MKCAGCGAQEVTTTFQDKSFGWRICPQWNVCMYWAQWSVYESWFRKQEGNGLYFTWIIQFKSNLHFRFPAGFQKEGSLILHKMQPRPCTVASPRTLFTLHAPFASQEWGVASLATLKTISWFACSLALSSLSWRDNSNGACLLLVGGWETLSKAERGQGEAWGYGVQRWLRQTCSGWVFGNREKSKLLSFSSVSPNPWPESSKV